MFLIIFPQLNLNIKGYQSNNSDVHPITEIGDLDLIMIFHSKIVTNLKMYCRMTTLRSVNIRIILFMKITFLKAKT